MPAITQVTLYSDRSWPERVLAQEVARVTVVWQAVEGEEHGQESVELYLTTAEREQLVGKDLAELFGIGHRPGTKGLVSRPREESGNERWRHGSREASLEYWREVRAFADAKNLRSKKHPERMAYETDSGKPTHPKWMVDMFEEWVAAGRPPLEQVKEA
jgi:hypothetical protein